MTERLQEAILSGQSLARQNEHQEVDDLHLFLAITEQENNLVSSVLEKIQCPVEAFKSQLAKALEKSQR